MIGIQELRGVAADIKQTSFAKESVRIKPKDGVGEKLEKKEKKSLSTEEPIGREKFEELLGIAQQIIFGEDTHYEFKLHDKTGTMMCKIVDNETDEIVRELPPEKILDMVAGIWELVGIIVDEKA